MLHRSATLLFPAAMLAAKSRVPVAKPAECSIAGSISGETAASGFPSVVGDMRVVTYNVRRFKAPDGTCTAAAIGHALAQLEPAIVALNEVDVILRPEALETLAAALGGFYIAFFGHVRGRYGNALLSKHRIVSTRETHLRGGTEIVFEPGTKKFNGDIAKEGEVHRIARGMLECDIEVPLDARGGKRLVTVAVTHLDHISEEQREIQIAHMLEALHPRAHRALIVGDLNALNRPDYADAEWQALEDRAAANNWNPPTNGCLANVQAAGFVDAFVASKGPGPLSARVIDPSDMIFTAHVGHPMYRIDYCFAADSCGLDVVDAKVQSDINLSDHFPVSFDFRVRDVESRL